MKLTIRHLLIFPIYCLCMVLCSSVQQLQAVKENNNEVMTPYVVPEKIEPILPKSAQQINLTFSPVVKKVAPAVVNIYAMRAVNPRSVSPLLHDPIFRHFFGEEFFSGQSPTRIQRSLGSGVLVRPDGIIITNNHVIKGAEKIKVVLSDNRDFDAVVVVREERTDLAVLKLEGVTADLPYLSLRDADELEVGDLVLAVGNPFGLGQTVTNGIISALARTQMGVSDFRSFIQTDAAINPGNSGGALVTLDGKLVGINTAIFSKTGGSIGIGFAIPSNLVMPLIASVDRGGKIIRPWLGANTQDVTAQIATTYGQEYPSGVLVKQIYPGSPADRAGLKTGDIILAFNDHAIVDTAALSFKIATREINHIAKLKILRINQPAFEVKITLEAPPESGKEPLKLSGRHPLSGATVANLSPALSTKLGLNFMKEGVLVLEVRRDSLAHRIGILPGDMIENLNGQEIKIVDDLVRQLARVRGEWKIVLKREGERYEINLRA
jgi:Do/DeqQ family serine protease